ncbi:MAG: hypothetical protein KIS67_06260 [Verrucomicrobiae bacterium]|nr:hypothetical protein [Verrucomicrobiae bacterium]
MIVLAAVLAAVIVSTSGSAPKRVLWLPDGVRAEYLGTMIGNATFSTELAWHRWLRKVLPRKWTGWIPQATTANCSSGTNSVTVYLRLTAPAGAMIGSTPWQGYRTEDDLGFRYSREGGGCSTGGGAGEQLQGLILRSYPRRQSSFWLDLLDQTNGVMARLRVPNPVRGPFPEWQASPLPQALTNGPVTLTLEGLGQTGREPWWYIRPKWNLIATDPAWSEARVRYSTLADATGNTGQWLSPREPAWLVQARVYRERFEDFGPSEQMVVTNLVIPADGEFVAIDQSAELAGVRVTAQVLTGAGTFIVTNGVSRAMVPPATQGSGYSTSSFGNTIVESWHGEMPFLLVEVRNAQPGDELFIGMFDEQGRLVELERDGGWSGGRSGVQYYRRDFKRPVKVQSVNLKIVVSRPLGFEFLVNPADVQPAKP